MLVKEMDISRLMVHVQQIDEEKIKKKEKGNMNKRARTGNFDYLKQKSSVEIALSFSRDLQPRRHYLPVFRLPSPSKIRKVEF